MYKHIVLPLDNSKYSNAAIDVGLKIAKASGAEVIGSHVYAARLHDDRFRQMESGLPPKYQNEIELRRQRDIHDDLITKGLQIISDSYLDVFEKRCSESGIPYTRRTLEGKNYLEIVKDVRASNYDLVVMGALGLGEVGTSTIGSVCERVMRRISTDLIITRDGRLDGRYMVGIDGSSFSYAGLMSAIALSRMTGAEIEAIAAFDPDFHYTAFKSIEGVLSEEAGKVFKFKEQEKLHEEIIDKGLAKIYQDHLDRAAEMAAKEGVKIRTTLLSGKPYDQIIKYVRKEKPSLLVMGRVGIHSAEGLDIGSNTENCARSVPCNIMIVSREVAPPVAEVTSALPWTPEAEELLNRIPSIARGMVKKIVEDFAAKNGRSEVTAEMMRKAREKMG